ncbi:MAG: ATP-binding protein [Candidatus Nanopelagicales bacterium]|nr:ATP-binding protein [Candidatus Nanopelagicales bacterium]
MASLDTVRRSLFLHGPVGRGKTGLAVGYAWECLRRTEIRSLKFVDVPDMLAAFRDTYNHPSHADTPTEHDLIARYANAGLLVLDDLGAEQVKNSGWVEDRLYQVIGRRHANEMPTVITSNLSLQQLVDRVGERVVERIAEMVGPDGVINLDGLPNLREI